MCDMHIPKSCYYPGGWDEKTIKRDYGIDPPNAPEAILKMNKLEDPLGVHENDRRGISFGVIGFWADVEDLPPKEEGVDPWPEIKVKY